LDDAADLGGDGLLDEWFDDQTLDVFGAQDCAAAAGSG
jgi:hypothetical protein